MSGYPKQSAPSPYRRRGFLIIKKPRERYAIVNTVAAVLIVSMATLIAGILLRLWPDATTHKNIIDNSTCILITDPIPNFKGGNEAMIRFISRNMKYPESAKRKSIKGTVYVNFVVTASGKINDVSVIRGIHDDCDKEAIRLVDSMPDWDAAVQNDVPVSTRMVLPIKFELRHH